MGDPAPDKQQGVAGHVVDAVALGVETVGYELLAGATLTTAAATAGMGAGHHVAGSAFDTAGATTVGSGFHRAGDVLYAVARKNFALAGEAARSALDSFVGPPRTQADAGVSDHWTRRGNNLRTSTVRAEVPQDHRDPERSTCPASTANLRACRGSRTYRRTRSWLSPNSSPRRPRRRARIALRPTIGAAPTSMRTGAAAGRTEPGDTRYAPGMLA